MLGQQVKQFNETYQVPVSAAPTLPTKDEMQAMGDMIVEELSELAIAWDAKDPVEFFDACLDIVYVTAQQAEKYGFPVDKGLREVHKSNMSKLDKDGNPIFREDGKVLKGPDFKGPDLKTILEESQNG